MSCIDLGQADRVPRWTGMRLPLLQRCCAGWIAFHTCPYISPAMVMLHHSINARICAYYSIERLVCAESDSTSALWHSARFLPGSFCSPKKAVRFPAGVSLCPSLSFAFGLKMLQLFASSPHCWSVHLEVKSWPYTLPKVLLDLALVKDILNPAPAVHLV